MPGLLTKKQKCKQIVSVKEKRRLAMMKQAMTYMQYIQQSCRKDKKNSIYKTTQQYNPSTIQQPHYSDTSANEDNSFRNHIR